ncbi:MAG: hypothetical protein ACKER6_00075 [Candidatus Hodgkinia cicadicola]
MTVSKSFIRCFLENLLSQFRYVWCLGCGSGGLALRLKTDVLAVDLSPFNLKCAIHNFTTLPSQATLSINLISTDSDLFGYRLPDAVCFESGLPSFSLWRLVYSHIKLNGISVVVSVTYASYLRIGLLSSQYGGKIWHIIMSANTVRVNSRLYHYRTSVVIWMVRKCDYNCW